MNKKKRAYKPSQKRATVAQMMPIAEGRKVMRRNLVGSYLEPIVATNNWRVQIPSAWLYMFRESYLEDLTTQPTSTGFTGRTLFSRFINDQVKIRFDKIEFLSAPVDLRIVYGWCKLPYLTSPEAIGSDTQTNVNRVKIGFDPADMISEKLDKQFLDTFPKNDPKVFKLMYNKRVIVRGQDAGVRTLTETDGTGKETTQIFPRLVRKDLEYRITWKPNRKYHMIPATTGNGFAADGTTPIKPDDGDIIIPFNDKKSFWTPSNTENGDLWYPFFACRINNPEDYGVTPILRDVEATNYPLFISQNTHYFLDV